MYSYYTLQVSHSDVTVSNKSKVPNLYVKISYGDQTLRTNSVNTLPPQWNETFPITCSDTATPLTIKLKKEETFSKEIGHATCTVKELLRENGEDVHITLQSQDDSKPSVALCLRPSDRMKNAEITLMNLAHTLLGVHPSNDSSLAEKVTTIFDTARCVAESKVCQSLVEVGYSITAFVEFGDGIAEASPYLKLVWCITTVFIKIISEQPRTDKRVKDLVKNLMGLFLINKETSVFANPSESLLSIRVELFEFITQCSTLLQDYTRKSFIVRAVLQNKKAAIDDLEGTLAKLKTDLMSAFERQGIIEAQIRALRIELEKKLRPKHESGRDRQGCLEGTRTELLKEIYEWIGDVNGPNVFFLLGNAGTGKSTVATTVAEKYEFLRQLGSRQYFLRGKSDPSFIFRTIAYGLAKQNQILAQAIKTQLDENELETATPDRAFDVLLHEPLHAVMKKEGMQSNVLIVLDALDECGSGESREPYIRLIKKNLRKLPPNYRFLITSRPERDIASLEELKQLGTRYKLLDHVTEDAKRDVFNYIKTRLLELKTKRVSEVDEDWPREGDMKVLSDAAGGLFIWASTAMRLIENGQDMEGELEHLVCTKSLSLEKLYEDALDRVPSWNEATIACFSGAFSLIMFGKEPLSVRELSILLGVRYGKVQGILNSLHSIVAFEPSQPVRLYHTSLYDYLISEGARGKAWFIDEKREKARISQRCFDLMKELRFNICALETSYKLNKDVPGIEERVKKNISASLLYACRHWASHLREVPYSEELVKQLEVFAFNRLLFWVEALSLTGSVYDFLLQSLERAFIWVGDNHSRLSAFFQDARAQFFRFIEPISQSSPHLYMSFLPLMREGSIVAEHYAKHAQSLTRVKYVGNKPRMACTRQINAGSWVYSISYSPDGERIASGSHTGVIEVCDVVSGRRLLGPLRGHSKSVTSVAYSADGKYIASGSEDSTVEVWNAVTGERAYGPLLGHSDKVNSVAFSGDGKFIASSSDDETIRLWDAESGAPIGEPLRGHSRAVYSVLFSPNGRYLASGSRDCTIIVWDVQNRKMISDPFKGHPYSATSLSFSPDGNRIASGSVDGTIRVWGVSTGNVLCTFSEVGMNSVGSVAYSGDGKHILSGSDDGIVRLWDAEDSDAPPKRFEGHTSSVSSVSFAPDCKHFASASLSIRVWDVEGGVTKIASEFEGQRGPIRTIAISPQTGKFLVSGSFDNTVCVWDTESGGLIKGPFRSNLVWSVAFSSNEIHFASGAVDGSIRIWNMIDDEIITCDGHTSWVRSLAFTPDGSRLASGSHDLSIRVWDVKNGSLKTELITGNHVSSVCYSPDGKKIVSGSGDNTVRIWNASNGNLLSTFEGHSDYVNSVAYSLDGLYIVSGSGDNTIRVWNTETGQAAYDPITGHADDVSSLCFTPDGRWIISSGSRTVCLWNVSTGDLFFQACVASVDISIAAAFPTFNNKYIKFASNSDVGTIHIWSVSSESKGEKWCLEDDGWLTGSNDKLLMWIPPDLRRSLVYGPRTLNTHLSISLDSSVYRGDQWTACFPSNTALT